MNTYFRASQHNLHQARTDLTVSERERERLAQSLKAQEEQYKAVERELAEEKELCRSLQSQMTLDRAQVIKDWKATEEFATLLDEEYAAAFPVTFRSVWTQAVDAIGAKVPEVTHLAFPVPGDDPVQSSTLGTPHLSPSLGDIPAEDQE